MADAPRRTGPSVRPGWPAFLEDALYATDKLQSFAPLIPRSVGRLESVPGLDGACGLPVTVFCAAAARVLPPARPSPAASRREGADVVALGEVLPYAGRTASVRLHQTLKGATLVAGKETVEAPASGLQAGRLALLFGSLPAESPGADAAGPSVPELRFAADAVDEAGYAYFARAPGQRQPAALRLAYYARFSNIPIAGLPAMRTRSLRMPRFATCARRPLRRPAKKWRLGRRTTRGAVAQGFLCIVLAPSPTPSCAPLTPHCFGGSSWRRRTIFGPASTASSPVTCCSAASRPWSSLKSATSPIPCAADGDVRHALAAVRFYREQGEQVSRERLARRSGRCSAGPNSPRRSSPTWPVGRTGPRWRRSRGCSAARRMSRRPPAGR